MDNLQVASSPCVLALSLPPCLTLRAVHAAVATLPLLSLPRCPGSSHPRPRKPVFCRENTAQPLTERSLLASVEPIRAHPARGAASRLGTVPRYAFPSGPSLSQSSRPRPALARSRNALRFTGTSLGVPRRPGRALVPRESSRQQGRGAGACAPPALCCASTPPVGRVALSMTDRHLEPCSACPLRLALPERAPARRAKARARCAVPRDRFARVRITRLPAPSALCCGVLSFARSLVQSCVGNCCEPTRGCFHGPFRREAALPLQSPQAHLTTNKRRHTATSRREAT